MDEPASDGLNPRVVVAGVVLVLAVAALAVTGIVLARRDDGTLTAGGTTSAPAVSPTSPPPSGPSAPTGTDGELVVAPCDPDAEVPRPVPEPTDEQTTLLRGALVGCAEAAVTARATAAGWTTRVIHRDGEDLAATMDFNPSRLNLSIEESVIIDVSPG
jgi:hypothetical protein